MNIPLALAMLCVSSISMSRGVAGAVLTSTCLMPVTTSLFCVPVETAWTPEQETITAIERETESPLLRSVVRGDLERCRQIIKDNPDLVDSQIGGDGRFRGWSAIHIAALMDRADLIEMLVQNGASASLKTGVGDPPIHTAVRAGSERALTALLKIANMDASSRNRLGETPLYLAVSLGKWTLVKKMVMLGVDVDARSGPDGALAIVTLAGSVSSETDELLRMMRDRSKLRRQSAFDGQTTLHSSARYGSIAKLRDVIQAEGANGVIARYDYGTPLHSAVASDREFEAAEKVQSLLKAGLSPDLRDRNLETALHWAVRLKRLDVIEVLLEADALVDAIDINRVTPGMLAVESGSGAVLAAVLAKKPNVTIPDATGRSMQDRVRELFAERNDVPVDSKFAEVLQRVLQDVP